MRRRACGICRFSSLALGTVSQLAYVRRSEAHCRDCLAVRRASASHGREDVLHGLQ
jgi:hypothetical protein